jgi:predicted O-methyltransferase YrrM
MTVTFMNRISVALMARRNLGNWLEVVMFLRRAGHPDGTYDYGSVDLHFRDNTVVEEVHSANMALSLLRYYNYSRLIGSYSSEDMFLLRKLGESINSRIDSKFSANENEKCSSGGRFHFKEVLLFSLIRKYRPDIVVETGVAQGVSSHVILSALNENSKGRLISIDLPNRNRAGYKYIDGTVDHVYTPEDLQPGWLVPEHLKNRWTLMLGRSEEILRKIEATIDMFFHDSEHSYENMTMEFEWAYSHLSHGGLLTSDDISWNNAFDHFLRNHPDMKRMLQDTPMGIALRS